jgi:hypothetical protein
MTINCDGWGDEKGGHCCHLGTWGVCPHLDIRENAVFPDRKFNCTLIEREGTWESVYQTSEYQTDVQPFFDHMIQKHGQEWNIGCGGWISNTQIEEAQTAAANNDFTKCIGTCCHKRQIMNLPRFEG